MNINVLAENITETWEICMGFVTVNVSNEKGKFEPGWEI